MPRGVTLSNLVLQLRAETGKSTSAAVGLQDLPELQQILRRTQETLYDAYDWPQFHTFRDTVLQAGQRFYNFPSDMPPENVEKVKVKWSGIWNDVDHGVSQHDYNQLDPNQIASTGSFTITGGTVGGGNQVSTVLVNGVDLLQGVPVAFVTSLQATAAAVATAINATLTFPNYTAVANGLQIVISAALPLGSIPNGYVVAPTVGGNVTVGLIANMGGGVSARQNDPCIKWAIIDEGSGAQWEAWPVPASSGSTFRMFGKRALRPLVADTDVADLDNHLIVLFAAAEKLAGKKDGKTKMDAAIARFNALKGRSNKSGSFRIGQGYDERTHRPGTVIRISSVGSATGH